MPRIPVEIPPFDLQPVPNTLTNALGSLLLTELPGFSDDYFRNPGNYESVGAISTAGVLLGVCCFRYPLDYNEFTIDFLAVQRQYQNGGVIGNVLLEYAEEEAALSSRIITVSSTRAAESFYLRHGYTQVEEDGSVSKLQKRID
jgi:ribosomal protein S18 acetylase RimI-like enzyme